jgi:hypothetical protein
MMRVFRGMTLQHVYPQTVIIFGASVLVQVLFSLVEWNKEIRSIQYKQTEGTFSKLIF